jgi:hypothetical protein
MTASICIGTIQFELGINQNTFENITSFQKQTQLSKK